MSTLRQVEDALVPAPPRPAAEFPVLDTLRAVGALAVLTTHAMFWAGEYTRGGARGTLFARLDVGVAVFFVLSGFLLSRPWVLAALRGAARPAVAPYARKRVLRILPLYLVTVVLALSFIDHEGGLGVGDWVRTLLMLDTVLGAGFPAGLTQMWSLAAEVMFYLALPLVMLVLLGRTPRLSPRRLLVGAVVALAVNVWWVLDGAGRVGQHTSGAPLQWLPSYLLWFGLGIALAVAHAWSAQGAAPRFTSALRALARQPGACWSGAAALLLVTATPLAGPTMLTAPTPGEVLVKTVLYAGVGFLLVVTGVFAVPGALYTRVMSAGPLRRLGWISYGIFCLHLPVLHLVMWLTGWELFRGGHSLPLWLLTVALSVVAAELAYRLVELPALSLAHRSRNASAPAAATTPSSGTSAR